MEIEHTDGGTLGLHFGQAQTEAAAAAMRRRLDDLVSEGHISAVDRRVAEVFVLGYVGLAPAELSRGVSPSELGNAIGRSLGWIVAQLCVGAPTQDEMVGCIAAIASDIGNHAMNYVGAAPVVEIRGERGGHA